MKPKQFFALCFVLFTFTAATKAQRLLLKEVADTFLGINPYLLSKETIANLLQEKYHLENVWRRERSKDSLFYMRGFTSDFNPFSIPVSQLEIQVREGVLKKDDSRDTILVIQVVGLTDSTEAGRELAKKEYQEIARSLHRKFYLSYEREHKKKRKQIAGTTYFTADRSTSALCAYTGFGIHYTDLKTNAVSITMVFGISPGRS